MDLNILRAWIASFALGSELWEDDFSSMFDLMKDYCI